MKAAFLAMVLGIVGCQTTQQAPEQAYAVGDCFLADLGQFKISGKVIDEAKDYYILSLTVPGMPNAGTAMAVKADFDKDPNVFKADCKK